MAEIATLPVADATLPAADATLPVADATLPAGEPVIPADDDAAVAVVVLQLGTGRYALPMAAIDEVGRLPALTRLPGVPSWLAGVGNWRGRVLAVLDLRGTLGEQLAPLGSRARLVIVQADGVTVGLVAESVAGVRTRPDSVEPPLPTLPPAAAALLAGQVTFDDGPIALLDVAAVLALRTALPAVRRGRVAATR